MSNVWDLPRNWLKVPNSIMAPRYERGEWIGFEEAAAPKADRDFIFIGPCGAVFDHVAYQPNSEWTLSSQTVSSVVSDSKRPPTLRPRRA
jgi:hypothetical protein